MADQGIYVRLMVGMRTELCNLKGAKLSVLIAIACHWDGDGAWPSIDTLMRLTGYSRSVICGALDSLESMKWIESVRRQHTSTFYRITTDYLQMGSSQSSENELPEAQSSESELPQPDSSENELPEVQSSETELSEDAHSSESELLDSQSSENERSETELKEYTRDKEEHTPAKARVCTLCKPIRDGSPPQQQILQKCHQLWRDRFGACPTQSEKKDRGILARLLNKHGPEFVMEVYETYLSDSRPYFSNHGWDIQTFYSSFDGLRLHHQKGAQNYAKRTGTDPADDSRI